MGCGRLFEGTAEQMHANLQRLAALPPETRRSIAPTNIRSSNGRFALTVEPDNEALARSGWSRSRRRARRGEATVPTTIALERATNPFMRALDRSRSWRSGGAAKDSFRG